MMIMRVAAVNEVLAYPASNANVAVAVGRNRWAAGERVECLPALRLESDYQYQPDEQRVNWG